MWFHALALSLWVAPLTEADPVAQDPPPAARARDRLALTVPRAPPKGKPLWVADFFAAMDEAQARNCPIFAILSDDQSVGFQTMWNNVYSKPEFAAACEGCVLLVGFDGREMPMEIREVDGRKVSWCLTFDVPVEQRLVSYKRIQALFIKREYWNPMHLMLDTYGVEITRFEGHEVSLDRVREEMAFAQEELGGRALSHSDYRQFMSRLKELVDGRQKSGHYRVLTDLSRMAEEAFAEHPGMRKLVEDLKDRLLAEGRGWLAEAEQLGADGNKAAARKLLTRITRSFRGTELARTARLRLKEL